MANEKEIENDDGPDQVKSKKTAVKKKTVRKKVVRKKKIAKKKSHQEIVLENKKKKSQLQNQKQQNPNLMMKEEVQLNNLKKAIQVKNQQIEMEKQKLLNKILKPIIKVANLLWRIFQWKR